MLILRRCQIAVLSLSLHERAQLVPGTRLFATASLVPHSGFLFLHPAGPALPPASPFHLHRFPFRELDTLCNDAGQLGFRYEDHLLADRGRRAHPHLGFLDASALSNEIAGDY